MIIVLTLSLVLLLGILFRKPLYRRFQIFSYWVSFAYFVCKERIPILVKSTIHFVRVAYLAGYALFNKLILKK